MYQPHRSLRLDKVVKMCDDVIQWPSSMQERDYLDYEISSYSELLENHQHRLFTNETASEITFRELDDDGESAYSEGPMASEH